MKPSHFPFLNSGLFLAACLLVPSTRLHAAPAKKMPNIVFIIADDLGWSDLSCYGSTFYETPNLDRLAEEGMRFTDAYAAAPVCSPSRASILTGKSPARLRITDWLPGRKDKPEQRLRRLEIQPFLPLEETTFAEALKAGGYKTAFFGKWHLGDAPEHWPEHQGFDLNLGGCGKGTPPSYFSPYQLRADPRQAVPRLPLALRRPQPTPSQTRFARKIQSQSHQSPRWRSPRVPRRQRPPREAGSKQPCLRCDGREPR